MKFKLNKKSQVSKTIMWIVATIIIIIIIVLSMIIASALGKIKYLTSNTISGEKINLLVIKSFFSYLLTQDSGKTVYQQLEGANDLNDFSKNLEKDVFDELHFKDYKSISVQIYSPKQIGWIPGEKTSTSEKVEVNENKEIDLVMIFPK